MGKGSTYNDYAWINARYGVEIGENTLIGPYVLIHSANHIIKPFNVEQNANDKNSWLAKEGKKCRMTGSKVVIGNDVWIGANVTILAGARIPDKCVIGAGSIITAKNSRRLKPGDVVVPDVGLRVVKNRKDL